MDGTDSVKLALKGQEYNFRFTLPRIKEVNTMSGKGLVQLELEAMQLHYGSIELLLWAGLAHPGNPKLKDATVEGVAKLFDMKDSRAITAALRDALSAALTQEETEKPENPLKPAAAA